MAGRYGIDAPLVPGLLGTLGLGLVAAGLVVLANGGPYSGWTVALVVWDLMAGLVLVASASVYLHTTLRGKFAVWSELLDGLALRGDERVLDMAALRRTTDRPPPQPRSTAGDQIRAALTSAPGLNGPFGTGPLEPARALWVHERDRVVPRW
jgi:hypothetical protein